jgi:succinyl-diaminopimelate desuccinylase
MNTVKKTILPPAAKLAQELIRIESVTPRDNGCQDIIKARLVKLGFATETLKYHEVTNLWATHVGSHSKQKLPFVVFAGHTDVVPPGPANKWTHPPFGGIVKDGILYGRGAVDMKGGIASFVVALERFIHEHENHAGTIGVLVTSDEEGEARWGTREVVKELTRRKIEIDMCVVGEPSSTNQTGDVVKIGRRGSLSGDLMIHGIQGHVAYPHLTRNPIHESLGALKDLVDEEWDQGTELFHSTTFQISNINSGTGATNVVPGFKQVHFNFRFSPASSDISLKARVREILDRHELDYELCWTEHSNPYITERGELIDAALASVHEVTGITSRACTSGGTSDGRFLAAAGAQVVELGPINKTIHKVNEHVVIEDLAVLADIYENLLERLLCKQ